MGAFLIVKLKRAPIKIENVNVLDGTPLLDIKPYIADFDFHVSLKSGCVQDKAEKNEKYLLRR